MLRSHRKEDNSQPSFRHTVGISRVKGTCSGGVHPFSIHLLAVAVLVDMSLERIFVSFEPELKAFDEAGRRKVTWRTGSTQRFVTASSPCSRQQPFRSFTLSSLFTLPRCFCSSRPFSAPSLRSGFYMHQLFPAPTQFAQIDDALQSLLINRF
jgi:hypothetical protein